MKFDFNLTPTSVRAVTIIGSARGVFDKPTMIISTLSSSRRASSERDDFSFSYLSTFYVLLEFSCTYFHRRCNNDISLLVLYFVRF